MTEINQLTNAERQVLETLTDAYHQFLELPTQHPIHQSEFVTKLHDLQRMVMSRPVARVEGWAKTNEEMNQ